MIVETEPLLRYAVERAADARLTTDALPVVWPVIKKARSGRYDAPDESLLRTERLCEAIAEAVRAEVRSVVLLSAPSPFTARLARYDVTVPFAKSLTARLHEAWYERTKAAYGKRFTEPSWPVFKDELRARIRMAVAEPLGIKGDGDIVVGPVSSAGESILVSLFHFLAALVAAEEKTVAAIRPLIETLTTSVPIGETDDAAGVWLSVLVPPRVTASA